MEERTERRILALLFGVGLLLSSLLIARSQVGGDQLNLLARGWLLVEQGELVSSGHPTSGGGKTPGSLTALLVGLPMLLWHHHRAPVILLSLFHVLAYAVLHRALKDVLSSSQRVLLALFYWLNPLRLLLSGFLWNPNFMLLFGALHLSTAFRQRRLASGPQSFLHVAALVLSIQLHASAIFLFALSLILLQRRLMKMHWRGAVAGGVVGGLSIIPWMIEAWSYPSLVPGSGGILDRLPFFAYPMMRAVLYWFRYPSFYLSRSVTDWDFSPLLGSGANAVLVPVGVALNGVLAPLSVFLPLIAGIWLWRRAVKRKWWRRIETSMGDRHWLEAYVLWGFLGILSVSAMAPDSLMWWHFVSLFHAAVLPVVLWLGREIDAGRRPYLWRAVGCYCAIGFLIVVATGVAGQRFRCGGHGELKFLPPLRSDHPMLHDLGIQETCAIPVNTRLGDPTVGFWPDVLPEAPDPGAGE